MSSEELAFDILFVGVAKMVWEFEIEGEGEEIHTLDYRGRIFVRLPRFGVVFKGRSEMYRVVLEREGRG